MLICYITCLPEFLVVVSPNVESVVSCGFKIHNPVVQAQIPFASYRPPRNLHYLHREHTVLLLFTNQPTATPVHVHRSHSRLSFHLWTGWLRTEKPGFYLQYNKYFSVFPCELTKSAAH